MWAYLMHMLAPIVVQKLRSDESVLNELDATAEDVAGVAAVVGLVEQVGESGGLDALELLSHGLEGYHLGPLALHG